MPYSLSSYGALEYGDLQDAFFSLNGLPSFHLTKKSYHDFMLRSNCDLSWTDEGMLKISERETRMVNAVVRIQRFFRQHQDQPLQQEEHPCRTLS